MLRWKQNIVIFVVVTVAVFIFLNIRAWFQYRQEKKKQMKDTEKGEFSQQDAQADMNRPRR